MLVCRYERPLARFLYGMVRDRELAADLCQETFLAACQRMPRLEDSSDAAAWLFTVALNKARAVLRRRRLIRWIPFVASLHDRTDGRTNPGGDQSSNDALEAVLSRLPTDQLACLLLHAEGLRYAEIAARLGCSVDAVRLRLFRARHACRAANRAREGKETQR